MPGYEQTGKRDHLPQLSTAGGGVSTLESGLASQLAPNHTVRQN